MKRQTNRRQERGMAMVAALMSIMVISGMCFAYYTITGVNLDQRAQLEDLSVAMMIAEAGASEALLDLRDGGDGELGTLPYSGGSFQITIEDVGDGKLKIVSTGIFNNMDRAVEIGVAASELEFNFDIRGAITSNAAVRTLGTLEVDGRDHDMDGNLVGNGTYGISTRLTHSRGGNSRVGGNGTAPAKPAPPGTVEENGPPPYPSTPEEALGLNPGDLDHLKTSVPPSGPLNDEIYYYTGDLTAFSVEGTGILIVSNADGDALLKNLNGGTFKGLIIADDIEHVHNDIIGAVIHLGNTASGNCIGNGNGTVKYSSEVLEYVSNLGDSSGSGYVRATWRDSTFD